MSVAGITMIKNEIDTVNGVIRHMADEVDLIYAYDNMSTDGTREVLDQLSHELPLTVLDDMEPAHYQSAKMSALAQIAANEGATWIIPFDADELWYSRDGRIREILDGITDGYVMAKLFNHFATALDTKDEDPFVRLRWRKREPGTLGKIAFHHEPGAIVRDGNHGVWLPSGSRPVTINLEIRHFPYRTPEQFVRKAVQGAQALALTDLPQDTGAHWRGYAKIHESMGAQALLDVYREHFWFSVPWESGMIENPAPYLRWQTP